MTDNKARPLGGVAPSGDKEGIYRKPSHPTSSGALPKGEPLFVLYCQYDKPQFSKIYMVGVNGFNLVK